MGAVGDPVICVVPGVFRIKPHTTGSMPAGGVAGSEEHGTTLYGLSRSCSRSFQMGTVFKEFNGTSGSNKNPFAGTCPGGSPVFEPFWMIPPGAAMAGGGVSVQTRARARNSPKLPLY